MKYLLIYLIFGLTSILYASSGSITGQVIEADTHQPLIGANVIIAGTELGSACDNEGRFSIKNIPVGSYTITVSMIGYSAISRANVNIYSKRQTPLKFYLNPSVLTGDMVTVRVGFFDKAKDGIVSTQTIDIEEIRSDPIGTYDIQMMLHSLPSVVSLTDQNNEIIVRGGGPGENLFIMDHLEIPNPNHFGEVGSGGGAVNILNTEFVERIDFFAGGFPARYGDKQSSVMDISLREGSYDHFNMNMEMTMAGIGLLTEGPFAHGKGSYISSFRRSFLKYIIKSTGMTAIPEYWNTQTKVVYNLDSRNKLMFNTVGGWDYIKVDGENRPDLQGAENVEHTGYQYTAGLTYKSLFSKQGYSLISIGRSSSSWITDVYDYTDDGLQDNYFTRDNRESDNVIKGDVVYKISPNLEISTGVNCKYGQYILNDISDPDTVWRYSYPLNFESEDPLEDYYNMVDSFSDYRAVMDSIPIYLDPTDSSKIMVNESDPVINSGGIWKYAVYSQMKVTIDRFSVTAGLRYDHVPYNHTSVVAPRIGLSYSITPVTKFNVAYGQYYQSPNYWMLMNPNNEYRLKHTYTHQQVAGIEHYFADDIKGTIEIYNKTYHNKPVYIADTTVDPLDERLGFADTGEGRAQGLELFLQKKFADKWYGTFSYSLSKSEGKDPRIDRDKYYPWDFDYGNVMTLIGGYKFKFRESKRYQRFRESTIFPYISWMPFMVSDQLEISFRYSYSGGRPYTPEDYDFIHRRWSKDSNADLNTARYDHYSRLDIMVLRRFNFKKINLTTFLDIQNIFDRDNIWAIMYLEDGTTEMSLQYKQMPVFGITIEF